MIANAIVNIWQAEGLKPILKYKDDLKIFYFLVVARLFHQDRFQYNYDKDEALSCISSLQVPWHKDKGDLAFLFVNNFIGFCWDLPNKQVSLLEEKHLNSSSTTRSAFF